MLPKLLGLLGITIIVVIIITLLFFRGRLVEGFGQKYITISDPKKVEINKSDPKWLDNYCAKEVKNLPKAPFKNKGLDGDVQKYSIPDTFLRKMIPETKWYEARSCGLWYKYDEKEAYPSVAVDYVFDIKAMNTFKENVDRLITKAMDDSWKKISPLSDGEANRPFYMYKGVPIVFTREKDKLNTVEFATIDFGASTFFVNLTVYEK